jgi:hypothetical protein
MSCEKCFAKVLSWVGFGHIEIAFIDALRLISRKLRNFSNRVKIKVTVNAYGYDYIHATSHLGVVCFHTSVGFLLFI